MGELPNVALSIMQPWAGLIVHGAKDIENRSWPTRVRGPVLIHAGKKRDGSAQDCVDAFIHPVTYDSGMEDEWPDAMEYPTGGIVGVAELIDCVTDSPSPWFVGDYGFIIRNARPLPFIPCRGALGFFRPDFTPQTPPPVKVAPTPPLLGLMDPAQ